MPKIFISNVHNQSNILIIKDRLHITMDSLHLAFPSELFIYMSIELLIKHLQDVKISNN